MARVNACKAIVDAHRRSVDDGDWSCKRCFSHVLDIPGARDLSFRIHSVCLSVWALKKRKLMERVSEGTGVRLDPKRSPCFGSFVGTECPTTNNLLLASTWLWPTWWEVHRSTQSNILQNRSLDFQSCSSWSLYFFGVFADTFVRMTIWIN